VFWRGAGCGPIIIIGGGGGSIRLARDRAKFSHTREPPEKGPIQ